tara:strand:+ start:452 stop:943 length:492 start_codon:yes stop_codon:yes gene_type:complete
MKKMAKKFPDLTGDGKVTQADILKGRGVKLQSGGRAKSKFRRTHNAAAKYPTRPKALDMSILEAGTPIRMLAAALIKRDERKRHEKEIKDYVDSLKGMGMFEEGGGRANVPKKKITPKKKDPGPRTRRPRRMKPLKVADGGRVTTFKNGGAVMTKTNQKPHMS